MVLLNTVVNHFPKVGFYVSAVQVYWKHCGKGEIARDEQLILFPQRFLPISRTFCDLHHLEIVVCKPTEFGRV